ncbi:hypothetical protein [Rhodococcus sp. IEGM 1318]|uniref:hypothetical protein n=1 Tax=Rhodococcus sp. IEGM 1318 TaxID=3082226 RepID=UPI002954424F|nr:hypothetical protein [Rhodococcus sp. IEGM 1318]MDV8006770.1 hypothetical protein [Rhodococcus sp. IEGM 1318]
MVSTTYAPRPDTYGPRIKHVPLHSHSEGENAIALAAASGLDLDQWQRDTLTAAMGTVLDNWAAPRVGILCPDQNDREHITLARELYELLLFSNRRIVHTAAEFKLARDAQRQLADILMGSNFLRGTVERVYTGNGEQRIEMKNGGVIHYVARTSRAARGHAADVLVFDHAEFLPEDAYAGALPILMHSGNSQLWMLGNAVDKQVHKHGHVFTKTRRTALTGRDPGLCWIEYSADDTRHPFNDPDRSRRGQLVIDQNDPEQWARANPGRILMDRLRAEQQAAPERQFLTRRLGIGFWPEEFEAAE